MLFPVDEEDLCVFAEPTSGHIQAGVEVRLMHVFAAELSAEFLKGAFSLSERRLQAADALHVLLCQSGLTHG